MLRQRSLRRTHGGPTVVQVFNPSWVVASAGTLGAAGLLTRSQNCTSTVGGPCVACSGPVSQASVLNFARSVNDSLNIATVSGALHTMQLWPAGWLSHAHAADFLAS